MISQQEAFWDKQRESLNKLREQIIDQKTQRRNSVASRYNASRNQSKPSSAEMRRRRSTPETDIIPRVVDHAREHMRQKAKSTTPPPRNLPRMASPNDRPHKNVHQKKVRGSKYNVVPPVKPRKAFQRRRREPSSDDSWGESESDSSDEFGPYPQPYPQQYPYPYMMPPPMYAPPPIFYQARHRPRRKKRRERQPLVRRPSYVLRSTHDQATHTVNEQGTQWQDPARTKETGISPMPSRAASRVSPRGGVTQRSTVRHGRGRTPRDVPVEIYVQPASRSSGNRSRLPVPEPEAEMYAEGENGDRDYDDESIYSREDSLDSRPEVPPRMKMPKYYYYYSPQRRGYNRDLFDERTNSVLARYKYFYQPNLTKAEPIEEERYEDMVDLPYELQVLKTMLDDEKFAESVVNKLIDDFLNEDLIPETLIDALSMNTLPAHHPMFIPSKQVSNDILQTEVVRMGRDIVREVVRELVDDYLSEQDRLAKDPLEEFLDNLFTETIMELMFDTAQDAVNEMAHEYIVEKAIRAVIMMMVNELIEADGQNLLDEAIYEVMIEGILDEMVYNEVIDGESRDLAHEVLNEYDTQIRRRAIKEINRLGREKMLESNLLDILLTKIARDGRIWTEAEYMDKMLHGMILDITLREHALIDTSRDATIENKAIKKVHEKTVTDVALDVVLDELTQWLDEDLAELDERERGINVQDDCLPTEVNAWLFGEVEPLKPLRTPEDNNGSGNKTGTDQKKNPAAKDQKPPDKRFSRFARVAGALI